jgi:hypothetical protein
MKKTNWEYIGECGVDSGQLMVTDPCYLESWVANEYEDGIGESNYSYAGACKATLSEKNAGQLHNSHGMSIGVAFSSGYGDGVYPVFAKKDKHGRIVEVKIKMG